MKEFEQCKQQLKEVQTKLSIEEKGRKGLLAELGVLHQVSLLRMCVVGGGGSVACEINHYNIICEKFCWCFCHHLLTIVQQYINMNGSYCVKRLHQALQ